jgi:toxin ParE1/3/4
VRLRWTTPAARDLAKIGDWIADRSPSAAKRVIGRIWRRTQSLATSPMLGRTGRVAGTRELVVGRYPYIVVYRVGREWIDVIAVMHSSRRWPEAFD